MNVQHDWPKNGTDYRRYHFSNPRRTAADGESYLRDFNHWLIEELQGFLPLVVAAECIEMRPSEKARADYNMPAVMIRWHVCIEVDEFPFVAHGDQSTFNRLMHFLGLKEASAPVEPLRVTRYYSFSPRQYEHFQKLMGGES